MKSPPHIFFSGYVHMTCNPCSRLQKKKHALQPKQRVKFVVRGEQFTTSVNTLRSFPGSVLAQKAEDGKLSIDLDLDPRAFQWLLNFLRDGAEDFVQPQSKELRRDLLHLAEELHLPALTKLLNGESSTPAAKSPPPAEEAQTSDGATFKTAPHPRNEANRLAALQELNVLQTDNHDPHYDALTRIVCAMLDLPIALISLLDADQQWFKSRCGLEADGTPRDVSFCSWTLVPEDPKRAAMMVVEDADRDLRFASNPLVTGPPYVKFYAGAPLVNSEGYRLGTLCCIDNVPRSLPPCHLTLLMNLAQLTVQALEENHLGPDENCDFDELLDDDSIESLDFLDFTAGKLRKQRMFEAKSEITLLVWASWDSMDWPILYAGRHWTNLTGIMVVPPRKFPGMPVVQDSQGQVLDASLWTHLEIPDISTELVRNAWSWIGGGLPKGQNQPGHSAGGLPVTFAISARVSSQVSGPGSGEAVSCRFSPGNSPLDANASAIRLPFQYSGQKDGSSFSYPGLPPGFPYFVTLTVTSHEDCGTEQLNEHYAEPVVRQMGRAMTEVANFKQKASRFEREISIGYLSHPSVDSLNSPVHNRISRQGGGGRNSSALLDPSRPPDGPFKDVRLLRVVQRSRLGSTFFGLWSGAAVMVKVIEQGEGSKLRAGFEGALSFRISHPNLVQTFRWSCQGKDTWILQEWCDGGNLRRHCKVPRTEGPGLREALKIAVEVANGIGYMHERGIAHGCLSVRTVLLKTQSSDKGYICKVSEFGLAKVELEGSSLMQADVLAYGEVFYHVLTGQALGEPLGTAKPIVAKMLHRVPASVSELCLRCIEEDSQLRPSMADVLTSITSILEELDGMAKKEEAEAVEKEHKDPYRGFDSAPAAAIRKGQRF